MKFNMRLADVANQWIADIYNLYCLRKNDIEVREGIRIKGRIFLRNGGKINIGKGAKINSGKNANVIGGDIRTNLIVFPNASLQIGDNVGISNCTIVCQNSITLENNVMLGGSVKIYDTDFHSIEYENRMKKPDPNIQAKPILIKEGAFIGAHSIILKGTTIGRHAVVGAGSVVTKNIPDNEIWAGNPAKFIRRLG